MHALHRCHLGVSSRSEKWPTARFLLRGIAGVYLAQHSLKSAADHLAQRSRLVFLINASLDSIHVLVAPLAPDNGGRFYTTIRPLLYGNPTEMV